MTDTAFVDEWIAQPLRQFVADSRVSLALVLHPSGQVIAQHGFTRAVDVMSACALAAAIHASSSELGKTLDGKPFRALHHSGSDRQLFLAPISTDHAQFLLMCVFDAESSLGVVNVYFAELDKAMKQAAPAPIETGPGLVLEKDFEHELNRNLAALFGR
jgi:predicted regulator of Ras-like GTPase activity (Roadblock/LC7/MglB family)